MKALIPLALLLLAAPASAQSLPEDDPRYRTFPYAGGGIVQLTTSPQVPQLVLFAKGERIETVFLSDPAAYEVSVSGTGDSLALRAATRKALAMMSVKTNRRRYELELAAIGGAAVPQVIRFSYERREAESSEPAAPPQMLANVSYRLSGARALRPASIADDGAKTYIAWHEDQPMPAVFAIGPTGEEEMIDGYVRAGLYTIDRVYKELVFRIDKRKAAARRVVRKGKDDG